MRLNSNWVTSRSPQNQVDSNGKARECWGFRLPGAPVGLTVLITQLLTARLTLPEVIPDPVKPSSSPLPAFTEVALSPTQGRTHSAFLPGTSVIHPGKSHR